MNMLVTIILLLCVLIGIESLKIISGMYKNKFYYDKSSFLLVPVNKNDMTIEHKLRSLINRIMWNDDNLKNVKIILVNVDADDETLEICRKICSEKSFIELCSFDNICSTLAENIK